jgi:EAL domain-containing protein (putative c-di-GMP-specific phosphodiesterase class I)
LANGEVNRMTLEIWQEIYGKLDEYTLKSDSFYEAFFTSNAFAVASLDKNFRIRELNHSFAAVLGIPNHSSYNRNPKFWLKNLKQLNFNFLTYKLKNGNVIQRDIMLNSLNGKQVLMRISFIPIHLHNSFTGVILIGNEVTRKEPLKVTFDLNRKSIISGVPQCKTLTFDEKIKLAINEKQFYLVYQPIVHIDSQEIVGYEALIRWNHPTDGIISPAQFIPNAESSGIIIEIEKLVLELACNKLKRLNEMNPNLYLSINISALHFGQNLVEHVRDALEFSEANSSQLKIEITETSSMKDIDITIDKLNQLKKMGIKVAIDDFGVGYSSLQYLGSFPADEIKLDRSFINPLTVQKLSIINAVFSIAQDLQIDVVVEGIETAEQLEKLKILGCKFGQGYLLGKPQEMNDVNIK